MPYSAEAQWRLIVSLVGKLHANGAIQADDLRDIAIHFAEGRRDQTTSYEHRHMLGEVVRMASALVLHVEPKHRSPPDLRLVPSEDDPE